MKPFPLRFVEYDPLTRIISGMDICDTVSLAIMSPEIRETIRVRDLEDVKMEAYYTLGKCIIEVKYKDGSSSKMLLFKCKSFPTTTTASYNIGGYPFKIGKTTNNSVIYTGDYIEEASVMLMEYLLTIFKSSKVHLHLKHIPSDTLRGLIKCEAFNFVRLMTFKGHQQIGPDVPLESVLLLDSIVPQSKKLLPEYRPVVSENRFRTDSAQAWMEDFHARKCPRIEIKFPMNDNNTFLLNWGLKIWQHGWPPFFQNLTFRTAEHATSIQLPDFVSITNGVENLTCWDNIGKREVFKGVTRNQLLCGYDYTVSGDLHASYIAYMSSGKGTFLDLVFWRPSNVI